MARERRRIALVAGWVLVGVSGVLWLLLVLGIVQDASEAVDVVLGGLVVTAIPIVAGVLLIRTGRTDRPVGELLVTDSDDRPVDDLVELRQLRRSDRLAFWGQVAGGTVVILGVVVLGVGYGGLSPGVVGGLIAVIAAGATSFIIGRRGHTKQEDLASRTHTDLTESGGRRFSNFAFSQSLPTWHGWRRDVGDIVIDSNGVTINGLKHRLHLGTPLNAKMYEARKWIYWTMVEVTGKSTHGQQMVVYLVAGGAPRSKFSANPEDIDRRGKELVEEVRSTFP